MSLWLTQRRSLHFLTTTPGDNFRKARHLQAPPASEPGNHRHLTETGCCRSVEQRRFCPRWWWCSEIWPLSHSGDRRTGTCCTQHRRTLVGRNRSRLYLKARRLCLDRKDLAWMTSRCGRRVPWSLWLSGRASPVPERLWLRLVWWWPGYYSCWNNKRGVAFWRFQRRVGDFGVQTKLLISEKGGILWFWAWKVGPRWRYLVPEDLHVVEPRLVWQPSHRIELLWCLWACGCLHHPSARAHGTQCTFFDLKEQILKGWNMLQLWLW